MNSSDNSQVRKRSLIFLLFLLFIGGIISSFWMPVALFPHIDFPRIVVSLDAGDRSADLMAIEVTQPVEEAVRGIPGIKDIRSTTSRGSLEVSVNFEWGTDMVAAMLQIESVLGILPNLPTGTTFNVRRMDPTVFPVIAYSLKSDIQSLVELRDLAIYQLKPLLSAVGGVANIEVLGGAPEEYRVTVDPNKLLSYGLSLENIAQALSADNVLTSVGRMEDNYKFFLLMSDTRLRDESNILNTVIRSGTEGVLLVEDVATISRVQAPHWTQVTSDGDEAIILQIFQQPGHSTLKIDNEIKETIKHLKDGVLKDVVVSNWYDQSELISSSALNVLDTIIYGTILAAFILYIFLRNIKITIISLISVPVVLSATVLVLYLLQKSFNIMTLGGMAAAVGLIIDDTIVMVEHITRRVRTIGGTYHGKVMQAAKEFTWPLLGASASTIIIFIPLAFFSGVTGAFFKSLSITISSCLIFSFLISWLVIPVIVDHFVTEKDAEEEEGGAVTDWVHNFYEKNMRKLLSSTWIIFFGIGILLLASFFSYQHVGSGFMPKMDEGGFILDYLTPPGTSLTETDRLLRQVESILQKNASVETYSRRTGLQLGGGLTEANQGDLFIKLHQQPRKHIEEVMDEIRSEIVLTIPGLDIELLQLMEDLIGDLTAVPQPIEIKLYSNSLPQLLSLAPTIASKIEKIPGVVDVKNGIFYAGDALDIQVDRIKASLEGMDPQAITKMIQGYLSGIVTTKIPEGPKMLDVRVWIPEANRSTQLDLRKLLVRAPDGHTFPLKRIATIQTITGQTQITRENLKQMIAVTARISGRDMGSVIADVKEILNQKAQMPEGVYYRLGGLYAEQQKAFSGLMFVFVGSIMLVFLLLLFLYESFKTALAILFTTLLAGSSVFIGLWITSTEINISSMMGLTMIIGIATKMTIFYYSEYENLVDKLKGFDLYITAGKNRMRPITMTILATILALLPLALAIGSGSAMQRPLAVCIISGLIFELPLVLIVFPVILYMMKHQKEK